jgi:uncharacterized protein (TIRG00374 family)
LFFRIKITNLSLTKTTKTALQTILFLAVGILLLYIAIGNQDLKSIWTTAKNANLVWITFAILCGILSHLARALRWNLLLEPMGYNASPWASFHAVILGYLVNMVLPRVGEITRPAVLSKIEKIPFDKLIGTVVVERLVDLLITVLIAVSIFFIQFQLIAYFVVSTFSTINATTLVMLALLVSLVLIGVYIAYTHRTKIYQLPIINKFKSFIEGALDGFKTIFNLKRKTLFVAYSLFIWLMYFCMPLFVLYALPGTAHLGAPTALTVLLFGTAAMIVPVPGGVGTFELMVPAALSLYGVIGVVASSYTLITHALQFIVILGVGVFSIAYFIIRSNKNVEATNS